jgi:hypothetical protein
MSYRHLLTLLGLVLVVLGVAERGWCLPAVWLGGNFLVLGVAHGCGLHRVFGKRADGTLPFLNCAQGHGRTGLFALAVLLSSGVVRSVDEGMRMLLAVRPAIRLSRDQRRCIETYAQKLG